MSVVQALTLALAVADGVRRGSLAAAAARDMIERMAAEGRDPTPGEWETLAAVVEDLHQRIQDA